jgi:hypothetical protein
MKGGSVGQPVGGGGGGAAHISPLFTPHLDSNGAMQHGSRSVPSGGKQCVMPHGTLPGGPLTVSFESFFDDVMSLVLPVPLSLPQAVVVSDAIVTIAAHRAPSRIAVFIDSSPVELCGGAVQGVLSHRVGSGRSLAQQRADDGIVARSTPRSIGAAAVRL